MLFGLIYRMSSGNNDEAYLAGMGSSGMCFLHGISAGYDPGVNDYNGVRVYLLRGITMRHANMQIGTHKVTRVFQWGQWLCYFVLARVLQGKAQLQ